MAERGALVVGVDSNPELLERARQDAPFVKFQLVENVHFWTPPELLDLVWSSFTIAYMSDVAMALFNWSQYLKRLLHFFCYFELLFHFIKS